MPSLTEALDFPPKLNLVLAHDLDNVSFLQHLPYTNTPLGEMREQGANPRKENKGQGNPFLWQRVPAYALLPLQAGFTFGKFTSKPISG